MDTLLNIFKSPPGPYLVNHQINGSTFYSCLKESFNLKNVEFVRIKKLHRPAVAFALPTQPARVRFSVRAFPRFSWDHRFSWCRREINRQLHCLECGQC